MRAPTLHGLDVHQTEFVKLVHAGGYKHKPYEIFRDFCELSALSISNAVDPLQFDKREARYMDIIKRYECEEIERFPKMLACIVHSLEGEYKDCLGQLFMGLELGNHWKGQFFTPYPICTLMAQVTMSDVDEAQLEKLGGFITVGEPTVGAGSMVIACAQALHDKQLNYQHCMHVTAQDIDATAVHMAYIQLSLLHIPAVVLRGNSLSNEVHEHWVTPAHVMGLWDIRLRRQSRPGAGSEPTASPAAEDAVSASPPTADLRKERDDIVAERVRKAGQMDLF